MVVLALAALLAQTPDAARAQLIDRMESRAPQYAALSRQIWEFAEVGYKESKSSALLAQTLREQGFAVETNIANIPTAFTATWGSGSPVIAILGEFDALPGLSQDAVPERKAIKTGAPGHGCGHNLFGVAAAHAAITVKEYLESRKMPGTIRFLGTPAEEGGGGKIYMARAGALKGVDVALTWHPSDANQASTRSSLANITAKFKFHGRAAHAAMAPQEGRSALDAVMLMNHGVELLREHIPQETRVHYIITNGGAAPNIVPDFAEVYLYARSPSMAILDGVWERIIKCAQAGALATETRMEMELVSAVYNVLPNDHLSSLFNKNLKLVGGVKYSSDEQAFAGKLRATLGMMEDHPMGQQEQILPPDAGAPGASTDFADVTWMLPAADFNAATWVPGTPAHSWQAVAANGMSIGQKGMMVAAKTLALTALDIFHDPQQVKPAREAFDKRRGGVLYKSRLPEGQKAPLNYRDTGARQ